MTDKKDYEYIKRLLTEVRDHMSSMEELNERLPLRQAAILRRDMLMLINGLKDVTDPSSSLGGTT